MPNSPAPRARPAARLRAWLGASLVHRLAVVTTALALAVLVPTATLSFTLSLRLLEQAELARLEARADLHASQLAGALSSAQGSLAALSANPLIITVFVDPLGWQLYGAPFLRSHRLPIQAEAQLALCDRRGRLLESGAEPPGLAPLDWIEPVMERGEWRAALHAGGPSSHLLLVAPVRGPRSGAVEGALVAEIPLTGLAAAGVANGGPVRLVDGRGVVLGGDEAGWGGRPVVERPLGLADPFAPLGLRVQAAPVPGHFARAALVLVLAHLAAAGLVLAVALLLARFLALRLTEPLAALAAAARDTAASGDAARALPGPGPDEIGQVAGAFNELLARLGAAQAATEQALRSEKREAVHALRLAHGALERSTEAISICEPDGRIAYVNEAACRLLGLPAEQLLGRRACEVDPALTAERWAALWDSVQATGRSTSERSVPAAGGPTRWLEVDVSPLRLGRAEYCVSVTRDVTSRHQAEAAQRLAGVGTLAAGAAHEINNPLTSIMGNLSYLRETLEEAGRAPGARRAPGLGETRAAVEEAYHGAERVRDVVRGLKAFARPDDEAQVATDVAEAMRGAVALARHELRHQGRLVERYDPAPPVLAAGRRLQQVFLNLLVNAAQALPEAAGEITVSVGTTPDGEAFAEVRDNGAGMAPEVRARVFEPFFTTRPVGGGTGLGLSVCHGIVSACGGRIEVTSEVGRGSAFRVLLPALAALPAGALAAPPAASPAPAAAALPPGLRLLVIDDDQPVVRAVARALGSGPEVVTLSDPHEALRRLLDGEPFDLVLCDLMMPGLSGMDLFTALVAARPALARRVILITGGAFTARARRFLATVPNPCLDKPFEAEALRRLVAERVAALGPPG